MRYGLLTFFLFFINGLLQPLPAQQYIFRTYTVNDGLVSNSIRRIFQDSKGFLWIATWEGLSRYDGHHFKNYSTGNGLTHELVNDIYEAGNGLIYIPCNDGSLHAVKNYEAPKDVTRHKMTINRLVNLPGKKAIALTDKQGIWEFTDGNLGKPPQALPSNYFYEATALNDSLLLASSEHSIVLLNQRYELFSEWNDKDGYYPDACLYTDSKKRTWLGTITGLKLLSPIQEKGKPIRFLKLPPAFDHSILQSTPVTVVFEDADSNTWIGTSSNGLIKIGADGEQEMITEKNGLPAQDITCIFQDREKSIWIGTSLGVAKLVTKNNIRVYSVPEGLLSGNVNIAFPFSDNSIIVESAGGLQLFDKMKKQFSKAPLEKNYFLHDDVNSNLSLLRNTERSNRYINYAQKTGSRFSFGPNGSTNNLFADHYGNFICASAGGPLMSRDRVNWKNVFYDFDTRAMIIDSKNNLWVGSWGSGLYCCTYEYDNNELRRVRESHFLAGTGIRSLFEDSKGNIWAGTRHNGVYCINPALNKNNVIHHFDQSTGLTSNRIIAIGEDKKGAIWLSFYQGLDKLIPAQNSYRVFNFSRFSNFFANIQSIMFDNDYSLWLGTTKGIVQISDGELEKLPPLKTYISSATLGDSTYRDDDEKKISIPYRYKKVQFEFAAPGFINEQQILYSYRLLGSRSNEWTQPANENNVSYASLQPGDYTFEVRSPGWNGVWGEAARYQFTITPPFWETWWFRLCSAVLIVAGVFYFVNRHIKAISREAGMRQKLVETEMAALRSQMNPHFIFNCLNAIDNLIQTSQKEKATVYLSRFAKLIRNVLDSSKNNAVVFQKDYESLQLYLQMEQFRCSNRFEYTLKADDELLQGDYKIPPLLAQPFVENAIHHGLLNKQTDDRRLYIRARINGDFIEYIIEDNGIGRQKAKELKELNRPEHRSYSIQITEERIQLYNRQSKTTGDVVITDLYDGDSPDGTRVLMRVTIAENK